jgi:uncharacterized SAM-binding protein YcdF (DUF218 family)
MLGKLFKLILIFVTLWAGGLLYFYTKISSETPKNIEIADAIIVLTGGKNRIEEALELLRADKAELMFISGVGKDVGDAELMDRLDVKPWNMARITLGHEAKDTFGNVAEAKKWIEENNIKSIILVTANYHMPRAYVLFHNAMPDVKITQYATIPPNFELQGWVEDEHARGIILSEYHKYLLSF